MNSPHKLIVAKTDDNHYMLSRACSDCNSIFHLKVKTQDYYNWNRGQFAQHAFPYLNAAERDLLITGFCGACMDKIFDKVVDKALKDN